MNPRILEQAKALGAAVTFNSREVSADNIQTAFSDIQVDRLVLETAVTPPTISLAIDIAGPLAQLALVGTLHHDLTLPTRTFVLILLNVLSLFGIWLNYFLPFPSEEIVPPSQHTPSHLIQISPLIYHFFLAQILAFVLNHLHASSFLFT
ncbi:zinc-binding dehydrogenase [Leptospira interrogans]|uniref:zinc-binding dehydrogenase n=1 Tax=Leptospira interrogans TaxID=173 RepID=UPI0034D4061D